MRKHSIFLIVILCLCVIGVAVGYQLFVKKPTPVFTGATLTTGFSEDEQTGIQERFALWQLCPITEKNFSISYDATMSAFTVQLNGNTQSRKDFSQWIKDHAFGKIPQDQFIFQ